MRATEIRGTPLEEIKATFAASRSFEEVTRLLSLARGRKPSNNTRLVNILLRELVIEHQINISHFMRREWRMGHDEFKASALAANKREYERRLESYRVKRRSARLGVSACNLDDVVDLILVDSKAADRKASRLLDFDLTFDAVRDKIKDGCFYCGETKIRMTLDRIDNALAHTAANTNGSCIRCNTIRRNMPYAAWLTITPSIRIARESGLFGDWSGSWQGNHSNRKCSENEKLFRTDQP